MTKKVIRVKPRSAAEFVVVGMGKGDLEHYYFSDQDRERIKLVPEPENEYDKHAIAVYIDKNERSEDQGLKKVGYVSRDHNKTVKLFLKRESDKGHVLDYRLIKTYSYSAQWLLLDLTLSLKERVKSKTDI